MDPAEIQHRRDGHKGAFVIERDGKRLAEMTYTTAGATRIIIDHTDVDDALRGTGAGRKLVEAAVLWAREQKIKILPLCPFAKSVFDKTPAYADVLSQ
jgi:predicted GNAT family acetyltransferase